MRYLSDDGKVLTQNMNVASMNSRLRKQKRLKELGLKN